MRHKIDQIKIRIGIVVAIQIIFVILMKLLFDRGAFSAAVVIVAEAAIVYYVFIAFDNELNAHSQEISSLLGEGGKEAFLFGEVGIVVYDDNYVVTWMSDLFNDRFINRVGKKVLVWLPEVDALISGKEEVVYVTLDDRKYEIKRKEDAPMLFFRDITETDDFKNRYEEEKVVIGMLNFDNYEESTEYEQ